MSDIAAETLAWIGKQIIDAKINGAVSVWQKNTKLTRHFSPEEATSSGIGAELAELIQSEDLFISPGIRPGQMARGGPLQDGRRSVKAGVQNEIQGLWAFAVDVDAWSPKRAHFNLPTSLADVEAIIAAVGKPPSMVVSSGTSVSRHAWWIFESAEPIRDQSDIQKVKRYSERFHEPMHEYAKSKGFHLDSTQKLNQWLRLPGSFNRKDPNNISRVEIVQDGPIYAIDELIVRDKRKSTVSVPASESTTLDGESTNIDAATKTIIDSIKRIPPAHKNYDAIQKILAGESFAERGERDVKLQETLSTIVFRLDRKLTKKTIAEALVNIYSLSLSAWVVEDDAEKTLDEEIEKLEEKLWRIFSERDAKDAKRLEDIAVIESALRRGGEPVGVLPPEILLKHTIILHNNSYFVYSFGWPEDPDFRGYIGPISGTDDLLAAARDHWVGAPDGLCVDYLNEKGELKQKSAKRLMQEYGMHALAVEGHTYGESYFDLAQKSFHFALAKLQNLEPTFNERIDEWLRLLGGEKQDKLLDWIASVPILDRSLCALYLEGPPAIGKSSVLAAGLAKLWRGGAPVSYSSLADGFTDRMFETPFVLLDEGLPKYTKGSTALIRSLIGNDTHQYNKKHGLKTTVRGYIRLMIAANNDTVLSQLASEDINSVDIEAIAGRFLHIQGHESAAKYINDLNAQDRATIDEWKKDGIARHALWLSQNRKVVPGKRFLVDGGEASAVHRSLVTRGEKSGLVLEWLCKALLHPEKIEKDRNIDAKSLFRVGNGQLLINTNIVRDYWSTYGAPEELLTVTAIGRVLGNLSKNRYRPRTDGKQLRFHEIDYENVKHVANTVLDLDTEKMEQNLNRVIDFGDDE